MISALTLVAGASWAEPAAEVSFAQGVLAYQAGDSARAVDHLRRALLAEPDHWRAGHYLGLALLSLDRVEEAVEALEDASMSADGDLDLQLDLGIAYLQWGNIGFAVRALGEVATARPDSVRARLSLGEALSRQGDCDVASEHLAEARRLDESLSSRTRYLAALCHARGGQLERVREELEPLSRSPRALPLADPARRLLRLSLMAEGIDTARVAARAALSVQYDSNPILAPRSGDEYVHSVAPVFELDATVRAVATARHTLAGRASFYRSFYFPDERASDYNYTHVAASAYYQVRGELQQSKQQLQIGYDFALGLFDGEPPLTDDNHLYSELHGARTVWSIRETDELQTRVSLLVQYRKFAMLRRNNLGATVGLGQTVAFPSAGLQLYVEATMRAENAASLEYHVVAPGGLVSLSGRLPWELLLSGWVLYEHERHPASTEDRVDDVLGVSLSLDRQILRHLGVSLAWLHTENISTVDRFAYRRDVVSLSLWGQL